MKNNVEPQLLSQLDAVFGQLDPRMVEEFYAAYQQWSAQQRIRELQQHINMVHEQLAENEQRIQQMRSSAISLAALARLQSNGVGDMALLDAMLERGEAWLDQTMQRLDYFEQFDDFIADDYTQWCQGALEGAFDWIDSLRDSPTQDAPVSPEEASSEELTSNSEEAGDVEALLLQRLAIEFKEDDLSWQEAITLKRAAIQFPVEESATTAPVEKPEEALHEDVPPPKMVLQAGENEGDRKGPHSTQPNPRLYNDDGSDSPGAFIVEAGADAEGGGDPRGRLQTSTVSGEEGENAPMSEPEQPALVEFAPSEELVTDEDTLHIEDEQPTLVEFAAVENPVTAETGPYMQDEQPTLVEFAAATESSQADETTNQIAEQATFPEIAIPEDSAAPEEIVQDEVNEASEVENNANVEVPAREQQAKPASEPVVPVRRAPRKRGLIGTLIWILTGK